MKTQAIVLALFLTASKAIQLQSTGTTQAGQQENKFRPGESADIGIDAESFADASVQARIDADLELDSLSSKIGADEATKKSSDIWNRHFQGSEFFKKYNAHVAERQEKLQRIQLNQKELKKVSDQYSELEGQFDKMKQQADEVDKKQQVLAQQIPGGSELLQSEMQDVNLRMKEVEEAELKKQPKKIAGVSFIQNQMPADKQNLMLDQQTLWDDRTGDNYNEELEDDEQKVQFIDEVPIEDEDIESIEYSSMSENSAHHANQQAFFKKEEQESDDDVLQSQNISVAQKSTFAQKLPAFQGNGFGEDIEPMSVTNSGGIYFEDSNVHI